MKLSFTTLGCPDWTLETIAARAKPMGYDGVELRTSPDGNHLSPDAPAAEVERVAALFLAAGTSVVSVMGYCRFALTDPAEVTANQVLMRKLIGIAGILGAKYIRTFGGQIPKDTDKDRMTATVAQALTPLAREAADAGITIGFETHDDWCAGDRVMRVVNQVNSQGLGVVYDIFNAFHSGLEPWDETYEKVKGHLAYCHLKDGYTGPDGTLSYVLLGAGDLPIADLLARFKRDGYDGLFSFEWEKKWHPEIDTPERAFPHFPHKVRALWSAAASGKKT